MRHSIKWYDFLAPAVCFGAVFIVLAYMWLASADMSQHYEFARDRRHVATRAAWEARSRRCLSALAFSRSDSTELAGAALSFVREPQLRFDSPTCAIVTLNVAKLSKIDC